MPDKQLLRSRKDRLIAGVCGGIAEYFCIDSVIIRVIAVLITLFWGSGILVYIILWIVVPEGTDHNKKEESEMEKDKSKKEAEEPCCPRNNANGQLLIGVLLVVLGGVMLFNNLLPELQLMRLWPILIIIFGLWLLVRYKEGK